MAAVYKSLSKTDAQKPESGSNGVKKNKQRVLILSSRGVTYRLVLSVAYKPGDLEGSLIKF
jgi:hypothetical protein